MSAAPAAAPAEGDAPKKGSKKLIIIIAAVAVLLLGGGGAAFFMMKKKAAEAEAAAAEDGGGEEEHAKPAKTAKKPEHGKDHGARQPLSRWTPLLSTWPTRMPSATPRSA